MKRFPSVEEEVFTFTNKLSKMWNVSEQGHLQQLMVPPRNVTIAGAFNAAVLSPDWVRRNILKDENPVEVMFPATHNHLFFKSLQRELVWWIERERFVVAGALADASDFARRVLEKLPETPVAAAGVNLTFTGALTEKNYWHQRLFAAQQDSTKLLSGKVLQGNSYSLKNTTDDGVAVTATLRDLGLPIAALDLNFNLDAVEGDEPTRSQKLSGHIRRFAEFEKQGDRIFKEVFGD